MSEKKGKDAELEWIRLQNQLNANYGDTERESFMEKLGRKLRQHPLVPVGVVSTVVALLLGFKAFYTGDRWMSQYMMRARVGAQAITVIALVSSMIDDPRFKLFDFSRSPALSSTLVPDIEQSPEVQSSSSSSVKSETKFSAPEIVTVANEAISLIASK